MEYGEDETFELIQIVLIGVGLIGKELIRQLVRQNMLLRTLTDSLIKTNMLLRKDVNLRIIGLANSQKFWLCNPDQPSIETLEMGLLYLNNSDRLGTVYEFIEEVSQKNVHDGKSIVVDCTASEFVALSYPFILSKGFHIVAANKKAFSAFSPELYDEIRQTALETRRFCLHEVSVGAGLPILSTITDIILTGDKIHQIEGIFSGTLSYIFATLNTSEKSFSEIVIEARSLGFTVGD